MPANIKSDVDLATVFRSKQLQGLHGFEPVAQTKDYTCGAAAVTAVLQYLGESSNEGQCAQSMGTNSAVGTTAEQMVKYLKRRTLNARAFTDVPFDEVINRARQGRVTLVDWNDYGGHWVVVAGVEPFMRVIVLADPARPRSKFAAHSYEQFKEHWHCDAFGRGGRFNQLAVLVDRYRSQDRGNGVRPREKRNYCVVRPWSKDHPAKA